MVNDTDCIVTLTLRFSDNVEGNVPKSTVIKKYTACTSHAQGNGPYFLNNGRRKRLFLMKFEFFFSLGTPSRYVKMNVNNVNLSLVYAALTIFRTSRNEISPATKTAIISVLSKSSFSCSTRSKPRFIEFPRAKVQRQLS